jgi:hypothetical protein
MLPLPVAVVLLACGFERADVKNLSDSQAAYVDLIPRTVEDLILLDPPVWGTTAPRSSAEFVTFQVVAELVGFKLEADLDFHVVLRGSSGETMIAEIPAPSWVRGSRAEAEIRSARVAFLKIFGRPRKSLTVLETPILVRVTGVVFFDKLHGQTGVAPNGVELHPVVALEAN